MTDFTGNCFRCGEYGHLAADCPELQPPTGETERERKAEHDHRLTEYRHRWETGQWTAWQKHAAISRENQMWHKDKITPLMTYPRSST